jgi:exodeoxyribonuclease V alpha subunit
MMRSVAAPLTSDGGETLDGTLDRIVYHNPDSHWTVARLTTSDGEVTAVGSLGGLGVGTPLRLHGSWVDDARYGRQFKVESYVTRSPETRVGIERYLGSGLVPGIGPELAKRLVDSFGLETLEVIERHPERLTEVDGIGPTRASRIANSFASQRSISDVMVFLRSHGVSAAYAARIFKCYGADAVSLIRENPYRLALDIWGIGFRTADRVAASLGVARDSPYRIEAGLIHAVEGLAEDGHVIVPESIGLDRAIELLGVAGDAVSEAASRLARSGRLVREEISGFPPGLALTDLYDHEVTAAGRLAAIASTPAAAVDLDLDRALAWFESERELELAPAQRRAISAAVSEKCTVITGGPGVGKTTIVRAVVTLLNAKRRRVALAAPTGRAAKRLSESTDFPASTLHRLLEFQPQTGQFGRNRDFQLDADVVVVDEASMIDIALFRSLLDAITDGAQLVLVGDIDQLPSVGPGRVLADVIASGAAAVVELTEIFRQAAASAIVTNAHKINSGELPDLVAPPGDDPERSDFYFVDRDDPEGAQRIVVELAARRIPERFGFDPLREIQVLAPMHRGALGTRALNQALQEALGAGEHAPAVSRGHRRYAVGDKVIQLRNNYDKDVFNGDVGVVAAIDTEAGSISVELGDGRWVSYEAGELDHLALAFAISIHKSQGSEYPAVVVPLLTQHYMMLQRNLLYTAITRGKRLVVLVGSRRALRMAVGNRQSQDRHTRLAHRVRARKR